MMLFDECVPKLQGDMTVKLLRCIAEHLSGRDDCKGLEYRVAITDNMLLIDPQREVFPNTHWRKPTDKISVVGHVMKYHFTEFYNFTDQMHEIHIKSGVFVPGRYVYKLSSDGKKRRWERDESL